MADEASSQELRELEEILRCNPELHFSLQTLTQLWQQSPSVDFIEIETAYKQHITRMAEELSDYPGIAEESCEHPALYTPYKTSFFRRNAWALTAFTAIVIIIGTVLLNSGSNKNQKIITRSTKAPASEISTQYGSKTDIVLPDGSRVWLNAGSKLTYDKSFGESVRNVNLTGEAYFDVTHNAEKPFVIHTTAMDIKVLGTEFNVKSYPDEATTEASLIRGSIEVTLKDKRAHKIIMKPSEKLVVNREKQVRANAVQVKSESRQTDQIFRLGHLNYFSLDSTILETSWVNNRLIFEDESFSEVVTRMSRWYGVNFEFADEEIQDLRFTGNFKNETVEEALKAMQITANFAYQITPDKNILITKH